MNFAGDVTGNNTAAVVEKLRGRLIQDVAPGNGDILKWSVGNSRWEPQPDDSALSWDALYALDKTLDIDSTVLTFDQSAATGTGFTVSRNQATSDAPAMIVANTNASDGEAALLVQALTKAMRVEPASDPVAPFDAVAITAVSGGLDNEALRGLVVDLTGLAGDLNSAQITGIDLDYTDGGGSNQVRGIDINGNWDHGVYSLSPVYVNGGSTDHAVAADAVTTVSLASAFFAGSGIDESPLLILAKGTVASPTDVRLSVAVDGRTRFGVNSTTEAFEIDQAGSGALFGLKASTSNRWVFATGGDVLHTAANPTAPFDAYNIAVTSGGLDNEAMRGLAITLTGDSGDLNSAPIHGIHLDYTDGGGSNQDRGINIGSGWTQGIFSASPIETDTDANVIVGGRLAVGSGTPTIATATGDSYVTGKLEVDGKSVLGVVFVNGGTSSTIDINGETTTHSRIQASTTWDHLGVFVGSDHGRTLVIGERAVSGKNYDHGLQTHPLVAVHSALDPDTDNTEYSSMQYQSSLFGGSKGSFLGIKSITELVTIPVGQGSTGVATSGNLAPVNSRLLEAVVRVTQAPGGGATTLDMGVTGGNLDGMIDGISTAVDTTGNSVANNDGVQTYPIENASATTLTLTTDADVTGTDMIVRVVVWYRDVVAPTS
jgi:hypothetical protein